ncbi:MAG: molybdopterin biosynthesis protein [Actinobacteria bacterium]|nr:molybdopterin biosynthesis protein [Actinomycetota bacterium]MBU2688416.1 molybdopterin biosynthesis protein [Actinomycetota bacterium]
MERNIYLDNVPLEEALGRWMSACRDAGVTIPLGVEGVPVEEALGRVTAQAVFALESSPPFHSSAMDGIAVVASDTYGATETTPVRIELGERAALVDTGEPLRRGLDAVIMVEDLDEISPGVFEIIRSAAPWQHVRPLGEDIVKSDLVLPRGRTVRPVDIGALLNAGVTELTVRRRPLVAIIPTGTELVESPSELGGGKVMESNSRTIAALVSRRGAEPWRMPLVPDDRETILASIEEALGRADLVVINAGTSAGREDYTRELVAGLGEVVVHGVAMKPGKPVLVGLARGKPVVGLPGFPVANYRGAEEFVLPMIDALSGASPPPAGRLRADVARRLFSSAGFEEFVQVKLGRVWGRVVAVPLSRGSGVSMSLVRSDGVVRVPRGSEGVDRWETVEVELRDFAPDIDWTILAIGSHDIALDLLDGALKERDPRLSIASANVGSLGGIVAVAEGQAHVGGTHLLDPATGDFNTRYVLEHATPGEVTLVHMAWRSQGFLVPRGNPRGIRGVEDLAAGRLVFINRQRGSGTRLLFDDLLDRAGVAPGDVNGYGMEVFTHTSVAAAVAAGNADTGLAVLAAAQALGLDFVPVASERYDLVVSSSFVGTPQFEALMAALRDPAFRARVEALGGYDLSRAGDTLPLGGEG